MKITREWIMAHRTKRGAWTRVQIQALGIKWPPRHGWIRRIDGLELSMQAAKSFEDGKHVTAKVEKGLPPPPCYLSDDLDREFIG